jgi:hypothetical protein
VAVLVTYRSVENIDLPDVVAVPGVLTPAPLQVTAVVVVVPFWVTTAVAGSAEGPAPSATCLGTSIWTLNFPRVSRSVPGWNPNYSRGFYFSIALIKWIEISIRKLPGDRGGAGACRSGKPSKA